VTTEISIPAQEIVSGRADAILCLNNENYVLDIKSINSYIFKNMQAPKEENVCQVQLYMHFFDIKKAILLYVDKDQQDIKEFLVDYDQTLCKSLLDKFYALKDDIEQNKIPARLSDYGRNWQCSYCQYKDICKMANGEEMSWEDFKAKMS